MIYLLIIRKKVKLGLETEVMDIMKDNVFVDSSSEDCYIFLKENPFYAESGGQVSDSGYLKNDNCKLEVMDVIKAPNGQHLLYVKVLDGTVNKGDKILTHVLKDLYKNYLVIVFIRLVVKLMKICLDLILIIKVSYLMNLLLK